MSTVQAATASRRLEGKVAIITGGSNGIGASTANLFHQNGAWVIIADIQDDQGQALAHKLGERSTYIHCDVTNEDDICNLIDTVVAKHGKLDIMYNNAGVIDRPLIGGILEVTKSDLDHVIGVNLYGAYFGAKHAARIMIPQRQGCILFTASAAVSIAGLSTHSYVASKYAVLGLVKNLTAELGEYGIRVNCVSPYAVVRSRSRGSLVDDEEIVAKAEKKMSDIGNLKGEILTPDCIAQAALYLASDEAKYVSGLNLVVDGGFSVVNPSFMRDCTRIP